MHYSQHHSHGEGAWGSQTFAQLAHQHGQSTAAQFSDVPPSNGRISDALKQKLAEEDLLDMEVLLRYRGIRTLRALESLETTERAVLLCKARELYEILGIFPSNLKNTLNKLFGDVPQQAMFMGSPWATQSGSMPYMHPLWAGAGGWGQAQVQRGAPEPLTDPLPDDTYLKRTMGAALLAAREIVGWERYTECLRRVKRSDELIVAACLEAAEGLAALGIRKEDVRDRERKEALKAAKKACRDVLLWRCTGVALGLDSREALVRAFEEACRHTHCDENTVSQLTNGYRRIREELAGVPPPPKRRRSEGSPERRVRDAANSSQGETVQQMATVAEEPMSVPAVIDSNGPSSSDPVLPHPNDAADLHEPGPVLVTPSFRCPPGLSCPGEKSSKPHSMPPARRSPGPRNRDGPNSLEMAQMVKMFEVITRRLDEVQSDVGSLQRSVNPFAFQPPARCANSEEEQ